MKNSSTARSFGLLAVIAIAGCTGPGPLTEYRPVVDRERTNMAQFRKDLDTCRAIATQVESDYRQRQKGEMARNILTGLLVGTIGGMIVGNGNPNVIAYGAVSGMLAGAVAESGNSTLVGTIAGAALTKVSLSSYTHMSGYRYSSENTSLSGSTYYRTIYPTTRIAYGAANGMLVDALTKSYYSNDLVEFGPRRVVDRCMIGRGHTILNDIGRG